MPLKDQELMPEGKDRLESSARVRNPCRIEQSRGCDDIRPEGTLCVLPPGVSVPDYFRSNNFDTTKEQTTSWQEKQLTVIWFFWLRFGVPVG
jgi:hypothetical protein